ncbi:lysophospholipase [Massilia pinisoli]|uniref:Lysophospholipase n=1 Tax=Massilia pinisoli TaxID=1772194 RepID=A0ABT1ZXB6_9BURK|nr:lysophospholipase [Massilia pinisoli]MCS0584576.1 lysophospholipase [Massilia pinisoli]
MQNIRTKQMKRIVAGLVILFAATAWAGEPQAPTGNAAVPAGELLTVPTRDGVTESLYVQAPGATPPWVIVLFAGDDGALHLKADGPTTLGGNFLIRTASYWVQQGNAAVMIDTPSDYANGIEDRFRHTKDSLRDVEAAVEALRKRFPSSRIALVGTSRGTSSVGNVLERNPGLADAFVLTSPVSIARKDRAGVSGLTADGTKLRVLVLSNRNDACPAAMFYGAKQLADKNRFNFIAVESTDGGGDRQAECSGHSPHGFLGIEDKVLGEINQWLAGLPH